MGRLVAILIVAVGLLAPPLHGGLRTEGRYSGYVHFDRWGACTLYSGVYVMYISEQVKDDLRPWGGQCITLNATKVSQPGNPGDGQIRQFKEVRPAGPVPGAGWLKPNGLRACRIYRTGQGCGGSTDHHK